MFSREFVLKIDSVYKERANMILELFRDVEEQLKSCTAKEQLLLRYLYGNMPLSDMVNYPFETFVDYARHGVWLWEEGPFRNMIGEDFFCQYVLFYRVNTEDISPCRDFFYKKISSVIKLGDSLEGAVLKLNYWCAQEVTYRSSDNRTASPMTTYRCGYGRCGEESTFAVSVLRSVGIAARQIYAPRWSHCDDNHAWVEVWCEGAWHFLGACEPEEVLDKGWFLHASSRAMLIQSRWFGRITPDEPVLASHGIVSELNQTSSYAHTKGVRIQVLDEKYQPVAFAQVRVEVVNYSAFYPITVLTTEADGSVFVELGLGSCRIVASSGSQEAAAFFNVAERQELCLILGGEGCSGIWQEFECFAPKDAVIHSGAVSELQKAKNKERLAECNALRKTKNGTGNEAEIQNFQEEMGAAELQVRKEQLLCTLSKKDYLDCKADILYEHLKEAIVYEGDYPDEIFVPYVLAPRIHNETLTAYRKKIRGFFTKAEQQSFRQEPKRISAYIEKQIRECSGEEYDSLITVPTACLQSGAGSRQSKDRLFVAICRSVGVPARLNPINGNPEYYSNGSFCGIRGRAEEGTLHISTGSDPGFIYSNNWTIARKSEKGNTVLNLSTGKAPELAVFRVSGGGYEIVTSNRLPNGNILAKVYDFKLNKEASLKIELSLQEARLEQMLRDIPIPQFSVLDKDKKQYEFTKLLGEGVYLMVWLLEGQEPAEHILNELYERAEEFTALNVGILFFVNGPEAVAQSTLKRTLQRLPQVKVYYDEVEERICTLGRRFYVDPEGNPLILLTDSRQCCVYAASGYNVGTGDMILKTIVLMEKKC